MNNRIPLPGCRPDPLLAYLKALGIFRLVAEQADSAARAAWDGDVFVLHTALDEASLQEFFLTRYAPTPIVAPWAGGSGFFDGDNTKAVDTIARSTTPSLAPYRRIIQQVRQILKDQKQTEKPQNEVKDRLLRHYRRELPDEFLVWMDSAIVIQNDGQKFPPLLGTGGNDGRLDFTQNLMQRLVEIGFADQAHVPESGSWLRSALFGTPTDGLLSVAIGQFDPGRAGGPNAGQGLEGISRVNPWEYILMLEGTVLLAGSVTRRLDINAREKASFPFTVNATAVNQGDVSDRGEIWLPLWRSPTGLPELRRVFSEGRAQVGRRQARNAVDFARAIAGLGVDRGLSGFTRFGFLKRSGKAYLATALGRFETHTLADQTNLLAELDTWLSNFRRACSGDLAQPRFLSALRRLDAAVFDFCRFGDPARFGGIVRALGQCEQALAHNRAKPGVIGQSKYSVPPVPLLSPEWLTLAQEDSPEFRLALALAGMNATGEVRAFRSNVEVVERTRWGWEWAKPEDRFQTVWAGDNLPTNLQRVLERRLMDATRFGLSGLPLDSNFAATADDINRFLCAQIDDVWMAEWIWGLNLIDLNRAPTNNLPQPVDPIQADPLPRAYALLKLLFLPPDQALQTEGGHFVKTEPSILSHLRTGRLDEASGTAARRLRASGYTPMPGPLSGSGPRPTIYALPRAALARLAAAMLIPVSNPDRLKTLVFRPATTKDAEVL